MSDKNVNAVKMKLCHVYTTSLAQDVLNEARMTADELLNRHIVGDWGDLSADHKAANDRALIEGGNILSAYRLPTGKEICVLTQSGGCPTSLLLRSEIIVELSDDHIAMFED